MREADLSLIEPNLELAAEFVAMLEEFHAAGETSQDALRERACADFVGLLREWRNEALGVNMAAGKVPMERYWLVRGGHEVLGSIHLRPRMEDDLARKIGHIGCFVRPSERCRGCATLMLRRMLRKARERGLSFVWLTCRKTNLASARAIRKGGGVLEGEFWHAEKDALFERYRIDLE